MFRLQQISYKLIRTIGLRSICLIKRHDWVAVAPEELHIDQKLCLRCYTLRTYKHKTKKR